MFIAFKRKRHQLIRKVICLSLSVSFSMSLIMPPSAAQAQIVPILNLPLPGAMLAPTNAFNPLLLKGLTIFPDDPFKFDFILNQGDTNYDDQELNEQSNKLIKYFLASLTIPENDLWVNLSPYESNRIIPEKLSNTELGRDMLAQDYILKQLTASLIYPENELGASFWEKVKHKAKVDFGIHNIPTEVFNKVWIVPQRANIFENQHTVYVTDTYLKVMLEDDYKAAYASEMKEQGDKKVDSTKEIIKEIILPAIEKEVNYGAHFAPLRQIYHALILGKWYKQTVKNKLLNQLYIDQRMVEGVSHEDQDVKTKIYDQYMQAYRQGVFNYIREDYDHLSQKVIPTKYFSGGLKIGGQIDLGRSQQFDGPVNGNVIAQSRIAPQINDMMMASDSKPTYTTEDKENIDLIVSAFDDAKGMLRYGIRPIHEVLLDANDFEVYQTDAYRNLYQFFLDWSIRNFYPHRIILDKFRNVLSDPKSTFEIEAMYDEFHDEIKEDFLRYFDGATRMVGIRPLSDIKQELREEIFSRILPYTQSVGKALDFLAINKPLTAEHVAKLRAIVENPRAETDIDVAMLADVEVRKAAEILDIDIVTILQAMGASMKFDGGKFYELVRGQLNHTSLNEQERNRFMSELAEDLKRDERNPAFVDVLAIYDLFRNELPEKQLEGALAALNKALNAEIGTKLFLTKLVQGQKGNDRYKVQDNDIDQLVDRLRKAGLFMHFVSLWDKRHDITQEMIGGPHGNQVRIRRRTPPDMAMMSVKFTVAVKDTGVLEFPVSAANLTTAISALISSLQTQAGLGIDTSSLFNGNGALQVNFFRNGERVTMLDRDRDGVPVIEILDETIEQGDVIEIRPMTFVTPLEDEPTVSSDIDNTLDSNRRITNAERIISEFEKENGVFREIWDLKNVTDKRGIYHIRRSLAALVSVGETESDEVTLFDHMILLSERTRDEGYLWGLGFAYHQIASEGKKIRMLDLLLREAKVGNRGAFSGLSYVLRNLDSSHQLYDEIVGVIMAGFYVNVHEEYSDQMGDIVFEMNDRQQEVMNELLVDWRTNDVDLTRVNDEIPQIISTALSGIDAVLASLINKILRARVAEGNLSAVSGIGLTFNKLLPKDVDAYASWLVGLTGMNNPTTLAAFLSLGEGYRYIDGEEKEKVVDLFNRRSESGFGSSLAKVAHAFFFDQLDEAKQRKIYDDLIDMTKGKSDVDAALAYFGLTRIFLKAKADVAMLSSNRMTEIAKQFTSEFSEDLHLWGNMKMHTLGLIESSQKSGLVLDNLEFTLVSDKTERVDKGSSISERLPETFWETVYDPMFKQALLNIDSKEQQHITIEVLDDESGYRIIVKSTGDGKTDDAFTSLMEEALSELGGEFKLKRKEGKFVRMTVSLPDEAMFSGGVQKMAEFYKTVDKDITVRPRFETLALLVTTAAYFKVSFVDVLSRFNKISKRIDNDYNVSAFLTFSSYVNNEKINTTIQRFREISRISGLKYDEAAVLTVASNLLHLDPKKVSELVIEAMPKVGWNRNVATLLAINAYVSDRSVEDILNEEIGFIETMDGDNDMSIESIFLFKLLALYAPEKQIAETYKKLDIGISSKEKRVDIVKFFFDPFKKKDLITLLAVTNGLDESDISSASRLIEESTNTSGLVGVILAVGAMLLESEDEFNQYFDNYLGQVESFKRYRNHREVFERRVNKAGTSLDNSYKQLEYLIREIDGKSGNYNIVGKYANVYILAKWSADPEVLKGRIPKKLFSDKNYISLMDIVSSENFLTLADVAIERAIKYGDQDPAMLADGPKLIAEFYSNKATDDTYIPEYESLATIILTSSYFNIPFEEVYARYEMIREKTSSDFETPAILTFASYINDVGIDSTLMRYKTISNAGLKFETGAMLVVISNALDLQMIALGKTFVRYLKAFGPGASYELSALLAAINAVSGKPLEELLNEDVEFLADLIKSHVLSSESILLLRLLSYFVDSDTLVQRYNDLELGRNIVPTKSGERLKFYQKFQKRDLATVASLLANKDPQDISTAQHSISYITGVRGMASIILAIAATFIDSQEDYTRIFNSYESQVNRFRSNEALKAPFEAQITEAEVEADHAYAQMVYLLSEMDRETIGYEIKGNYEDVYILPNWRRKAERKNGKIEKRFITEHINVDLNEILKSESLRTLQDIAIRRAQLYGDQDPAMLAEKYDLGGPESGIEEVNELRGYVSNPSRDPFYIVGAGGSGKEQALSTALSYENKDAHAFDLRLWTGSQIADAQIRKSIEPILSGQAAEYLQDLNEAIEAQGLQGRELLKKLELDYRNDIRIKYLEYELLQAHIRAYEQGVKIGESATLGIKNTFAALKRSKAHVIVVDEFDLTVNEPENVDSIEWKTAAALVKHINRIKSDDSIIGMMIHPSAYASPAFMHMIDNALDGEFVTGLTMGAFLPKIQEIALRRLGFYDIVVKESLIRYTQGIPSFYQSFMKEGGVEKIQEEMREADIDLNNESEMAEFLKKRERGFLAKGIDMLYKRLPVDLKIVIDQVREGEDVVFDLSRTAQLDLFYKLKATMLVTSISDGEEGRVKLVMPPIIQDVFDDASMLAENYDDLRGRVLNLLQDENRNGFQFDREEFFERLRPYGKKLKEGETITMTLTNLDLVSAYGRDTKTVEGAVTVTLKRNKNKDAIVVEMEGSMYVDIHGLAFDSKDTIAVNNASFDEAMFGGIDMNTIPMSRDGQGITIEYDPTLLTPLLDRGFTGFTPVINSIVPIPSILPLLGLSAQETEHTQVSSLN